ncbi:ABC transporter ATP-binding protein [[Clostridium] spiroforme]|nr:ABC transporter ATP-binding protein [Thomasclavelia spiroformis]MBM6881085.1 ABC transporter ATP-binding protein [Thomasclavelia spiroformis]MBM6930032.1 ABC transporter ATP-binding protein [Thomasclavelia spiroformis]
MLELNHVTKKYPDFKLNCSLTVHPGCITGLIGQNGAGKTTVFKAILDLIRIDSGSIRIDDHDQKTYPKENIGVVLADAGFSEFLKIKDIVAILENMYEHFDKAMFMANCQKFALPLNKKISTFSTGMKAKLKVLIALSHQSKLLILDEPTAGLDVLARDEILDLLRDYMLENDERSILISSHISSDLENLCDDIYMIDQGQIILHEDIDTLFNCYALLKTDHDQFNTLDKTYILKYKKEPYGYICLTNQRQFYLENYPEIVIEKNRIDDLFTLMIRGE